MFVSVPSDGNALDCGSENSGKTVINGGNVIACGGTMMAERPDSSSKQCTFMYSVSGEAGSAVRLETSDGKELFNKTIPNSLGAITVSMPELNLNETYKLTCGDQTYDITLTDTVTSNIEESGPGGIGGGPGGNGKFPGGQRGDRRNFTPPSQE